MKYKIPKYGSITVMIYANTYTQWTQIKLQLYISRMCFDGPHIRKSSIYVDIIDILPMNQCGGIVGGSNNKYCNFYDRSHALIMAVSNTFNHNLWQPKVKN